MTSPVTTTLLVGTALIGSAAALVAVSAPLLVNDKDDRTSVTLSADARRTVEQDRVAASLNFEATGKTSAEVQAKINAKMQDAKKLYDTVTSVKTSTGHYNVYKQYANEPRPKADGTSAWTPEEREANAYWQGSQALTFDGVKNDDLLKLISSLQKEGFALQNLNFYMSREAEDKVKDALIAEALANIQKRAENIRKTLGMRTIDYGQINLNTGGRPVPMMRAMAMKAEMAYDAAGAMPEPVVEAGETEVTMSVSAEVKLK